jgi:hypothetical protein
MNLAQLRELLALVPEMRAEGVKRFRLGEIELELGERDFVSATELPGTDEPTKLDPSKCLNCQAAPPGGIVRGWCRACGLRSAGVTS